MKLASDCHITVSKDQDMHAKWSLEFFNIDKYARSFPPRFRRWVNHNLDSRCQEDEIQAKDAKSFAHAHNHSI